MEKDKTSDMNADNSNNNNNTNNDNNDDDGNVGFIAEPQDKTPCRQIREIVALKQWFR